MIDWTKVKPGTQVNIKRQSMNIKSTFMFYHDEKCWVMIGQTGNIMTLQGIFPDSCEVISNDEE